MVVREVRVGQARDRRANDSAPQQTFPWHQPKQRKPNGWWDAWHRRLSITWSAIARNLNPSSGIVAMTTGDLTRRGFLPDGQGSRGFVMVELEVINRVSPEALAYLIAFRRRSFIDENDGVMTKRQAIAVGYECGFPEAEMSRVTGVTKSVTCHNVLDELQRVGWFDVTRDSVRDRGYLTWNIAKLARQRERNSARDRKRKERERQQKHRGFEAAAREVSRRDGHA